MRPSAERDAVQQLVASGLNDCDVARKTGIPRSTVRDWRRADFRRSERALAADDDHTHAFDLLPASYAYLLGAYLGDGNITHNRRGVHRLRITLDLRYPLIISQCREAMTEVMPANPAAVQLRRDGRCVEVNSYSKHWPCFFPQNGPGRKHQRTIALTDWQSELCDREPELLLTGLIHSDGCRSVNRVKGAGKVYAYPRYTFTNHSADIRRIFCDYLDALRHRVAADGLEEHLRRPPRRRRQARRLHRPEGVITASSSSTIAFGAASTPAGRPSAAGSERTSRPARAQISIPAAASHGLRPCS